MIATVELPHLEAAINEESFDFLSSEFPALAKAVEKEVRAGRSPEDIGRGMMQMTQRQAIALRCRQAAAYLAEVEAHVNGADIPAPLRAR